MEALIYDGKTTSDSLKTKSQKQNKEIGKTNKQMLNNAIDPVVVNEAKKHNKVSLIQNIIFHLMALGILSLAINTNIPEFYFRVALYCLVGILIGFQVFRDAIYLTKTFEYFKLRTNRRKIKADFIFCVLWIVVGVINHLYSGNGVFDINFFLLTGAAYLIHGLVRSKDYIVMGPENFKVKMTKIKRIKYREIENVLMMDRMLCVGSKSDHVDIDFQDLPDNYRDIIIASLRRRLEK